MTRAFLFGKGVAFPLSCDKSGALMWSEGDANIVESIKVILLTAPGERLFRPDFGAGLQSFQWQPNTASTRQLLVDRIEKALQRDEPRIRLEAVVANAVATDAQAVVVEIRYRLVATQAAASLSMTVNLGG